MNNICYVNLLIEKNLIEEMENHLNTQGENFIFKHKDVVDDGDLEFYHFQLNMSTESEEYTNLIEFLETIDEDVFKLKVSDGISIIEDSGQLDMDNILGIVYDEIDNDVDDEVYDIINHSKYNLTIRMKF